MSFTFKLLRENNSKILEYYQAANELWTVILSDYDGNSTKLSSKLSSAQFDFERISGRSDRFDRWDMQEVMVFSGLTYFLDSGSEEEMRNAQVIAEAFEMSYCSIEVKGLAKRFAKMLHLGGFSI
jgi:hypothetical protein